MKRETIQISIAIKRAKVRRRALVDGPLAIHPTQYDSGRVSGLWTITHVASGAAVATELPRGETLRRLRQEQLRMWRGESLWDVKTCDLLLFGKEIASDVFAMREIGSTETLARVNGC